MKDTLKTIFTMGGIAMLGNLVKYLRHHRNENFDWKEFAVGMLGAAMAGIIVHIFCDWFGLPPVVQSAVVAMAGYCGAQLLDVVAKAVFTVLEDGLRALIDWFSRK